MVSPISQPHRIGRIDPEDHELYANLLGQDRIGLSFTGAFAAGEDKLLRGSVLLSADRDLIDRQILVASEVARDEAYHCIASAQASLPFVMGRGLDYFGDQLAAHCPFPTPHSAQGCWTGYDFLSVWGSVLAPDRARQFDSRFLFDILSSRPLVSRNLEFDTLVLVCRRAIKVLTRPRDLVLGQGPASLIVLHAVQGTGRRAVCVTEKEELYEHLLEARDRLAIATKPSNLGTNAEC